MEGMRGNTFTVLLTVGLAGLIAAAGQVALLRELLSLFRGYEPAAGLLFASWLLWGALGSLLVERLCKRAGAGRGRGLLRWLLPLFGLLLPVSLLVARAAPHLWDVAMGVRPEIGAMCGISFILPMAFCFCSGAIFAAAWQALRPERGGAPPPISVYLAESLGAACGGLLAWLVLVFGMQTLTLAVLLAGAAWLWGLLACSRRAARVLLLSGVLFLCIALPNVDTLEQASLRWRFGPDAVTSCDTPYQRVALTRSQGELSLFGGGGWMFTVPDRRTVEWAAHPALLLHKAPRRVLFVGGYPNALAREACRHPTVEEVEYVEADRELLEFVSAQLAFHGIEEGRNPRLRIVNEDPMPYVRAVEEPYDVVVLALGEPVNAQLSRFYSLEFLRDVRKALSPEGLLAIVLPQAPQAFGPAQEAQMCSLQATVAAVFPWERIVLGEQAFIFAGNAEEPLPLELDALLDRLHGRGLQAEYVREENLAQLLSPFRQSYVHAMVEQCETPLLNRVLRPQCYYNSAVLWLQDAGTGAKRMLLQLGELQKRGGSWLFWGVGGVLAVLLAAPHKPGVAVPLAVAMSGGAEIVLELGLLLAFQGLAGSLYGRVALLVGAYMGGLGLGAWLVSRRDRLPGHALRLMLRYQWGLCLTLAISGPIFIFLFDWLPQISWTLLFVPIGGLTGVLGGGHFGLAVQSRCRGGATLYAMDLAGAALGSALTVLIITPLAGVDVTLGVFALLIAGSACGVWRGRALLTS